MINYCFSFKLFVCYYIAKSLKNTAIRRDLAADCVHVYNSSYTYPFFKT